MKKLIIMFAILFLGMVSTAQAHTMMADGKTTDGAAYHTWPVFNNSSSALDEGDVVVWDVAASTGNNDLYVNTTTTANTGLVAGVVTSAGCVASSACDIIIFGLAKCDTLVGLGVGEGGLICTSGTAGDGVVCTAVTDEGQSYAIASESGAGQIDCFVTGR